MSSRKRVGQARCPYCNYTTTTGGIRWHLEHCSKNPKAKKAKKKDVLVFTTCKTCLGSGQILCENTFSMIIYRCYECDGKGQVLRSEKEVEKEKLQEEIVKKMSTTSNKLLNYLQANLETQIICSDDDTLVSLNEVIQKLGNWRIL